MHAWGNKTDWHPSMGELARRIDHVDDSLHDLQTGMINTELYKAHREQIHDEIRRVHDRLDKIDDDKTWTRRLLISVLFTGVMSLVVQFVSNLS